MKSSRRVLQGALRHAGTLRSCIQSPEDVWLAARMAAWAAVLPVLKRTIPLQRLVNLVRAMPQRPLREPALERRIVALAWWLHAPLSVFDRGCLQRSLLAYRFLGAAGAQPHLAVGMQKEGGVVRGHAWVVVDGAPAGESRLEVAQFAQMLVFGPDGHMEGSAR